MVQAAVIICWSVAWSKQQSLFTQRPLQVCIGLHCQSSLSRVQIVGPVQVARRSDVDMNGHINNVTYLAWTLETVPLEIFQTCELKQVSI